MKVNPVGTNWITSESQVQIMSNLYVVGKELSKCVQVPVKVGSW